MKALTSGFLSKPSYYFQKITNGVSKFSNIGKGEAMATDARITIVRITPYGEECIKQMRNEIYAQVGGIIDKVGMEKLHEFIEISEEIRAAPKLPAALQKKSESPATDVKFSMKSQRRTAFRYQR